MNTYSKKLPKSTLTPLESNEIVALDFTQPGAQPGRIIATHFLRAEEWPSLDHSGVST